MQSTLLFKMNIEIAIIQKTLNVKIKVIMGQNNHPKVIHIANSVAFFCSYLFIFYVIVAIVCN